MGFGVPHLYRSTTFGASWTNITANLPNAPANAVVVDPNDANTVYVALDAGVYVTQAIATCATSNCWSVLGTALPNAPIVSLAAAAMLPTGDGRFGMLRAGTYGRGLWQTPLLTATSSVQAALTLSATSLSFAAQQVATQSAPQTVTITSSGGAPVTFSSLVLTGDFTETDNCAGQTLAVGTSCSVQVVFAPTATGARSGQLTIYANVPGGQATVALNGTGTAAAAIVLAPLSLTFPATIVNQTAASQNITVSNTGGTTATLAAPVLSGNAGDFAIFANTCGATLAPQTGCTLSDHLHPHRQRRALGHALRHRQRRHVLRRHPGRLALRHRQRTRNRHTLRARSQLHAAADRNHQPLPDHHAHQQRRRPADPRSQPASPRATSLSSTPAATRSQRTPPARSTSPSLPPPSEPAPPCLPSPTSSATRPSR